jgi:hypothetical protein
MDRPKKSNIERMTRETHKMTYGSLNLVGPHEDTRAGLCLRRSMKILGAR